jgi:hypothetical protein
MRVPVGGVPVMRSHRLSLLPVLACMLIMPTMAKAGPTVYRCETAGKVAYSDSPCIGASIVDATPTQGMDKMSGQSRKGKEVQQTEFNRVFDDALKPLTGRSTEEMGVLRRRVKLPGPDQQACARLDGQLPTLELDARNTPGAAKARAEFDLYGARKRYFELKC